jgi:peptidoglycan/LPS O-acetylase OafA/YrhL
MRIRFASYLAIGLVSAFLIVASYAFAAHTFWWIALIGGIALLLLGLAVLASARPSVTLAAPAAVSALLGLALAVISVAASHGTTADWGLGLAIAGGAMSVLGLTEHELVAERELHGPGMPAAR